MNRQEALKKYIQAILPEREQYLSERVQKRIRAGGGSQTADGLAENRAFESALYHAKRSDKVYQALIRGELVQEYHLTEFELLCPYIQKENKDKELQLDFVRSVQKSRVSLDSAYKAAGFVAHGEIDAFLKRDQKHIVSIACAKTSCFLSEGDLTSLIPREKQTGNIIEMLIRTVFQQGVSSEFISKAFQPGSMEGLVFSHLKKAFPILKDCQMIVLPDGRTVSAAVKQAANGAADAAFRQIRKRFPEPRIRGLLAKNHSVRTMQQRADANRERFKKIRSALLQAVPQHYRDLYPLARRLKRSFIIHLGPTNSGKTYEAVGRLRGAVNGIYLGPLRLLAAEQFETLNLHDIPTSLVTGEEQILVPNSRVQSSTVEMADLKKHYDVAVIDECQMISDRDRGGAWTAAILGLCADEIHLCASPDAKELLSQIILDCGDTFTIVNHERMTPLTVENDGFSFPESVRPGDALIVFSKARVHAVAAELKRIGFRVSLIYGVLPPDVRRDQALRFQHGDNDVVVSTDAIAMGMNLPIERVVFLEDEKYDGDIVRPLTDAEIKQIAGRAGRYGQYDIGYVNAFGFRGTISRALAKTLPPLTEAIIRFPDSLLGIPLPLSGIINQWIAMKDKGCFSKASSDRMAKLVAMLETPRTDKALLYRFVCIPFDETEPDLLARWKTLYHAECAHMHVNVINELPEMLDPETCTVPMLGALEAGYRRCDLYYNYVRLFLEDADETLAEIQRRKDLISKGIIHILSTQKLEQRVCPKCRRRLAWNWPYRICDTCYRKRFSSRNTDETEFEFD